MDVKQVYQLVNNATSEILGESAILQEDLSNVVDVGTAIINADAVERYAKALVNHIGRVIFVDRVYQGVAPGVLMDGWEFGSVLEKVRMELPDATENESWELEDGSSYDPNIFTAPKISAKFFNKRVTFEVPMSFTEKQIKQSFSNATQLNAFVSMIYTGVENSMTVKLDALVMRTINAGIGETIHAAYGSNDPGGSSTVKAVNLLYLFNARYPNAQLTAANAVTDPDFIRFASYTMGNYIKRLKRMSTLFNIGATEKFTPEDRLHVVMLSDFMSAAGSYLQSDTFHDQFTALPQADLVPYWQGTGTSYAFDDISKVNITTPSNDQVEISGVLAVMFDRDALGVTNMDRRVTTNYNGKAEFVNNWFKMDAGYFLDLDENFVVFFVADPTGA